MTDDPTLPTIDDDGNPATPFNPTLHEELIAAGYRYLRCKYGHDQPEYDWDEYISPDGAPSRMIWVSSDGSVVTHEEGEWNDPRLEGGHLR